MFRRHATHRAPRGYATDIVCLIRDDAGKVDLTGKAIAVQLRRYASHYRPMTLPGVGGPGNATFTVPATLHTHRLYDSLYRIDVTADGVLVYEALLEIT